MPSYNPSTKKAIYKYRETHTDEYLTNCKQYYLNNKEKLKSMRRNLYHYREEFNYDKECKRLRKILLLDI
jgi:hypothetical protein